MAESAALIKASSNSAAADIQTEAEGGDLWGVSMGTTSEVSSHARYCLIKATPTRIAALEDASPSNAEIVYMVSDTESFTGTTDQGRFWYLLGAAEAE